MATTGTDLEWPADLPCPQELPTQSAERRVLGDDAGLFESRVGQTDRKAFENYVFPPYSPAQALALDYFWTVTLNKGGRWFSATWWRPEGKVPTARRFVGPPNWEYIHTGKPEGGYWRVSGTFEVRGTGELPVEPDPPSAWNPLDVLASDPDAPIPIALTNANRIYTRGMAPFVEGYDVGVRGFLPRGTLAGEKRYVEIKVLSAGFTGNEPGDMTLNQCWQFGLIDATSQNVLQDPLNDTSEITPTGGGALALVTGRFDGVTMIRLTPSGTLTTAGTLTGGRALAGDVFGFAWHVGTDIKVYRNGALAYTFPFTSVVPMYPYCSAGAVNISGPNTTGGGESFEIASDRRQFAFYPPPGFYDWG